MIDRQAIRRRWEADGSKRDERGRRLFAASEVRACEWGGLAAVSTVTGLVRSTIERGLKDLDPPALAPGQVRGESRNAFNIPGQPSAMAPIPSRLHFFLSLGRVGFVSSGFMGFVSTGRIGFLSGGGIGFVSVLGLPAI